MEQTKKLLEVLENNKFKVSTDSRKPVKGTIYFGIKGENFDGNTFVKEALEKGAVAGVTDNPDNAGDNIFVVGDSLKTLQMVASEYRNKFSIPIIAIGGSNGKTTSKELLKVALKTKYKIHGTNESFNNHVGVPLTLLRMDKNTQIGVFEIGANHPKEHLELLDILRPTHVVVTNNGMDHLEGFGSPQGVRKANKELYDWAVKNKAEAFVDKKQKKLISDSTKTKRILYPTFSLKDAGKNPLTVVYKKKEYKTKIQGNFNIENVILAVSIAKYFKCDIEKALKAICRYSPTLKRSQFLKKNKINFVVDCYNANPTSMKLSLESFNKQNKNPKGIILGDMLEMGKYSDSEHKKIVRMVFSLKFDCVVFVGENFKKALVGTKQPFGWFSDSTETKEWFHKQKFDGFTFLLKGSKSMKIGRIIE